MIIIQLLFLLALSSAFANGATLESRRPHQFGGLGGFSRRNHHSDGSNGGDQNDGSNGGRNSLQLDSNNVQQGSQSDGNPDKGKGESPSLTDDTNFINFCSGKTLTNGQQQQGGSCNGIVMGEIPSTNNMISTIITSPSPGDDLQENTDFDVKLQVQNLEAGSFTNADSTYYSAPQQLSNGNVVGHTHITIQSLGNDVNAQSPPDPNNFAFFKGVNDAGDGNGGLSATVDGGLSAGAYRVCTMTAASNHQPVIMPVAQRGAQDDCTKFTVGQGNSDNGGNGGNDSNSGGNDGSNGEDDNNGGFGGRSSGSNRTRRNFIGRDLIV